MVRLLVIVPVFGREDLTSAVVADIAREAERGQPDIDVVVVDNHGGYQPRWRESVYTAGTNLGWLGGSNWALEQTRGDYDAYALLNNDVRLSTGFFVGLARAQQLTKAGLVAPAYDATMGHQRVPFTGPAVRYKPQRRHWKAAIVDGTCMYLPAETIERVGLLDPRFMPYGWGAEIDYSFRVWDAGMRVVITALAFLNHRQGSTFDALYGDAQHAEAWRICSSGLSEKYGRGSKGWGPRSGIDAQTESTQMLTARERLVATLRSEARAHIKRRDRAAS